MYTNGTRRVALRAVVLTASLNLFGQAAATAATCEGLVKFKGTVAGTTISSATVVSKGAKLALPAADPSESASVEPLPVAFCRVVMVIPRAIKVEMWLPLPDIWNGKLRGVGNGGMNGLISYAALADGVKGGYATVSSDLGHSGGSYDGSWAVGNADAVVDWGYRATHEMTVAAKGLIDALYGSESVA